MSPKLPGLGDVDWGRYVSALTDIGYQGDTCIEIEDKAFEGSVDQAKRASAAQRPLSAQLCDLTRGVPRRTEK